MSRLFSRQVNRRNMVLGSSVWATGLGAGVNITGFGDALAAKSAFDEIVRASIGAVAASYSDFAVQSPEGNTCTARLVYPLVVTKRLPVLVFCPDEGSNAGHYDQLTGALAAQGFFILAIDRRPVSVQATRTFMSAEQQMEQRLRQFAEARFLLDTIDAAAATLGPNSEMLATSRMGTIGHGTGAWMAVGLGGWDSSGAASTRTRDGRVHAVVGLFPARSAAPASTPAARSPEGVSGLFIGNLAQMPIPERGSGLLGLGLPSSSSTFGGLIGAPPISQSRRIAAEPQVLAAAIASMVLFFDWTLRGDRKQKKELLSLNGRRVEGLTVPLQLNRA